MGTEIAKAESHQQRWGWCQTGQRLPCSAPCLFQCAWPFWVKRRVSVLYKTLLDSAIIPIAAVVLPPLLFTRTLQGRGAFSNVWEPRTGPFSATVSNKLGCCHIQGRVMLCHLAVLGECLQTNKKTVFSPNRCFVVGAETNGSTNRH